MNEISMAEDIFGIECRHFSGAEIDRIHAFKELAAEMLMLINATGTSRELEAAQTRLEEAVIWSVKHVARHGLADGPRSR